MLIKRAAVAGSARIRVLRWCSVRSSGAWSSGISTSRSWATRSTKPYPKSSHVCASRGDSAAAIPHRDPLAIGRHPSDLLHTALPDLRFSLPFLALGLRFPCRGEFAQEGFQGQTPQELLHLRIHRQHRLQTEADVLFAVAHRLQFADGAGDESADAATLGVSDPG